MILAADILPTSTKSQWSNHQQELEVIDDWLSARVPFIKKRASLQRWLEQLKKEEASHTNTEEGSQPNEVE
jgi:hypothetical protein